MSNAEFGYGKIFVNAELVAVRAFLSALFEATPGTTVWVRESVEVEVRKNPDQGAAEDFIGWPTFVEIAPESGDTSDSQVLGVAQMVSGKLSREFGQTVTAANYEEMLRTSPSSRPACGT